MEVRDIGRDSDGSEHRFISNLNPKIREAVETLVRSRAILDLVE